MIRRAAPALALVLCACDAAQIVTVPVAIPVPQRTEVRQIPSNVVTGPGERLNLFVFDPAEPRPLDERLRLATREARRNDCALLGSDRELIERETARRGGRSPDSVLVAPVRCEG